MDPIILRFLERILAVGIGGMAIFLGYRMFLKIPESRDGSGRIVLPWNISVVLTRVGPGVFFALFGAGVVALSIAKGLEVGTPVTSLSYATSAPLAADASARADARALLRRDIAVLNNIVQMLRPDLPEHERDPMERAISRIKLALMKPVWERVRVGARHPTSSNG